MCVGSCATESVISFHGEQNISHVGFSGVPPPPLCLYLSMVKINQELFFANDAHMQSHTGKMRTFIYCGIRLFSASLQFCF